ncbi:helix-turn-helix domain-containing protein [Sphingomonas sp. MMS24-JH45]
MAKGIHEPRYRALIDKLVVERKRLGISQQTLAVMIGMPQQIVSRVETGDRRLDIVEFADVAAALGLDAHAVTGGSAWRG